MYILFVLTTYVVIAQAIVIAIMAAPFGTASKVNLISGVSKQSWSGYVEYVASTFLVLEAGFFLFSLADVMNSKADNESIFLVMEAQRDCFASAFALFNTALLRAYFQTLQSLHRTTLSHDALKKQASQGGSAMQAMMEEKEALEAQLKALEAAVTLEEEEEDGDASSDSSGDSSDKAGAGAGAGAGSGKTSKTSKAAKLINRVKALSTENEDLKDSNTKLAAKVERAQKDVEAVRRQSENQAEAFFKLTEENTSLRSQLGDYDAMMGGARKKNA